MKPERSKTNLIGHTLFFMLFQSKWRDLPFVIPEVLLFSKYADDVLAFLRFCQNLLAHAEQHQKAFKKHFGAPQTRQIC